jgi:hypothetical protein
LKVVAEDTGSDRVAIARSRPPWLLYFRRTFLVGEVALHTSEYLFRSSVPGIDASGLLPSVPASTVAGVGQDRGQWPGRVSFTFGVAMSSTCVAFILISFVNGQVAVPAGGQVKVPTPSRLFSSSWGHLLVLGLGACGLIRLR